MSPPRARASSPPCSRVASWPGSASRSLVGVLVTAHAVLAVSGCTLLYSPDDYESAASIAEAGADADAAVDGADAAVDVADAGDAGRTGDAADAGKGTCAFTTPVRHVQNPSTGAEIFTVSASEVTNVSQRGFEDRGVAFAAATAASGSHAPVFRVLNPTTGDRLFTVSASEKQGAAARGYTTDEGIGFYVSGTPGGCVVPVYGLQSGARHTLVSSDAERAALEGQGWNNEGIRFYAAAP